MGLHTRATRQMYARKGIRPALRSQTKGNAMTENSPKKRKPKNFAVVNGACKKLKTCPWCGHKRGTK